MSKGVIYILTNPSFPEYVKIGYSNNIERRLEEFNRCTEVPFAFRIYATYEVDSDLSDKKVHAIIDKLNPGLRSQEEVDGIVRKREFYNMSPQDAYDILEAMAEIHNCEDKLVKYKASATEEVEARVAEVNRERLAPFSFTFCGIGIGETVEFWEDSSHGSGTFATVVDDKHVEYQGEKYSLTGLVKHLFQDDAPVAGPRYFKHDGEWLNDLRKKNGHWRKEEE